MAEITADVLNSLAAKLDGLDLTEDEQAVVDELFSRAEAYEPEVEGFAFNTSYDSFKSGADLSATAFRIGSVLKLGGGIGMFGDPTDPRDPTKPPPP